MSEQIEELVKQPEALRLADALTTPYTEVNREAATELRRLHEINAKLLSALKTMVVAYHPPKWETEGALEEYLMEWFPEWTKARAVIRKANGETE